MANMVVVCKMKQGQDKIQGWVLWIVSGLAIASSARNSVKGVSALISIPHANNRYGCHKASPIDGTNTPVDFPFRHQWEVPIRKPVALRSGSVVRVCSRNGPSLYSSHSSEADRLSTLEFLVLCMVRVVEHCQAFVVMQAKTQDAGGIRLRHVRLLPICRSFKVKRNL